MGYENDPEKKRAMWLAWYHRTKNAPEHVRDRRERRRRRVSEWRARVTEIKVARGCADCGERHPACLDFHHLRDKKREVSLIARFSTWQEIEREIEKCIVLCVNCHLKRHGRRPARPVAPRVRGRSLDGE